VREEGKGGFECLPSGKDLADVISADFKSFIAKLNRYIEFTHTILLINFAGNKAI
jgi:hypothetical protein